MADPKAEPLASKPAENTPLIPINREEQKPPVLYTTLAVSALVIIAVTKTQLTAFLFSSSNYPTAYSLYSCVVTCILLVPVFFIVPGSWSIPTRPMAGVLTLIVVFTALDLGFTNIALANISTALQQCIAATNPFWTILIESVLYMRVQHWLTYLTVTLLVVGAVLASLGEAEVNTFGLIAAVIGVLSSASKYVFCHTAFKAFQGQLGAMALLFWVDLFMIPIYLVWTLATGELIVMVQETFTDAAVFGQMTGTAALGGVRALSQYVVLALLTATSMSCANSFQQILNIVISITITQSDKYTIGAALIVGICLNISSSSFYAFIKAYKPFLPWLDNTLGCGPNVKKDEYKPPA